MIRAVLFEYRTIFSADGSSHPGVDTFVHECATRFPLILLTDTSRTDAEASLAAASLNAFFLDILTTAEVDHRNPAPDLLIAALGRFGFLLRDRSPIEPGECLVVESSNDGVEAARRARMHSLTIGLELLSAEFNFRSFTEIDLDRVLRQCSRQQP